MQYKDVLDFWFTELSGEQWFDKNDAVDAEIKSRFLDLHAAVAQNECANWRMNAEGALAEIIVLDQFSRNIYRDAAHAFRQDGQALALAQVAVAAGLDHELEVTQRLFLYMPYMHSESKKIHEDALELFTQLENAEALKYERIHKEIIDRFGRYPHRNAALGRESTAEELQYLADEDQPFF